LPVKIYSDNMIISCDIITTDVSPGDRL
jgi:hypothetical protein